jgi:F420-dependent oxidoreductase-like protein
MMVLLRPPRGPDGADKPCKQYELMGMPGSPQALAVDMSTGIILLPTAGAANHVDDVVAQARKAHQSGVRQVWLAQQFDHDAITLAGLVGAAVPGLGVGTSVVPINPRHPLVVASQAQTAQAAAHGNFSLGLGLGAHGPEHQAFGTVWPNTIDRLREHLSILRDIFGTGSVDFQGNEFSARPSLPVGVAGGTPVPVYVAAMGPKALRVTGELADGTLPYLAGPRTIAEFIAPQINAAAAEAGRPAPRILAAVPVLVADDVDAARDRAAEQLSFYETIASYQKIIAREGVAGTVDIAAIGPQSAVVRQLGRYLDAGATDLILSPLDRSPSADHQALWDLAAELDK